MTKRFKVQDYMGGFIIIDSVESEVVVRDASKSKEDLEVMAAELEKDLNENVKKIVTDNANKIYEETGLVYDNETETWNETSDMGSFDENGDVVDHSEVECSLELDNMWANKSI